MRGRLGLWGDAVQLKCLLQASVRPGEDKIKSIRLSPSSSCFSDSKATGTSDVRRSVRACVCVHTSLCVFVQVYSILGGKEPRQTLHLLLTPRPRLILNWWRGNNCVTHWIKCTWIPPAVEHLFLNYIPLMYFIKYLKIYYFFFSHRK